MKTSVKSQRCRGLQLLVLGVNGLDWGFVSEKSLNGSLPCLSKYACQGASGPLQPERRLNYGSSWTTIATGRRAFRNETLKDIKNSPSMQPGEPPKKRVIPAFWNILSKADVFCNVVGWPGISRAEKIQGTMVAQSFFEAREPSVREWPIPEHSVAPAAKGQQLSAFRLHPEEVPSSWVSALIPPYFSEEPEMVLPLAAVRSSLAMDRAKLDMAMHWIQEEECEVATVCISGLETICNLPHRFPPCDLSLPEDTFRGLADRTYEWYDAWIQGLLNILPPGTNVVIFSDHGVLGKEHRNLVDGPSSQPYEEKGCLIVSGPGFVQQIPLRRATLLDICPTILHLYGIQQNREMDGVVLEGILSSPKKRPSKTVSWSQALVETSQRRDMKTLKLRDLCRLGIALLDAGQLVQAVSTLRLAWEKAPDSLEIAAVLASALFLARERLSAAGVLFTALQESTSEKKAAFDWIGEVEIPFGSGSNDIFVPSRETYFAIASWLANPDEDTVNQLFELFRTIPDSFLMSLIAGVAASSIGLWKEALSLLGRASALDVSNAEPLIEIARVYLRRGMPKDAVKTARLALEKSPLHFRGAMVLADALFTIGDWKGAAEQARRAAKSMEQRRPALLILARICQRQGDLQMAFRYRRVACRTKQRICAVRMSFPTLTSIGSFLFDNRGERYSAAFE